MNYFAVGAYVAFVIALLQVLSYIERAATLRGSHGAPMPVWIDKSLRTLFLVAWAVPLLLLVPTWVVAVMFFAYLPLFLDGSEASGRRESPYVKSWRVWSLMQKRLKITLRPTVDLPRGKYIIAIAPHGILPFGSMFALFSNVANVKTVLPNLDIRCLAASFCFYIPLYRDILLAGGVCDAARYNARALIDKGFTLALVPGGATEALYAGIGRHTLFINKRLGFIRLAMQTGSKIVPVYGFGENDTWDVLQTNNQWLLAVRAKWQRIFGISLPLIKHIFPRRTKIDIVLGAPIAVPHIADPTDDQVRAALETYKTEMAKLWHAHKDEYARTRIEDITFV
jgi:2-acylglycerol O-acyltransferase 2